jgi:DNA repair exonuclease SbcCD ATPase subunit
MTETQEQETRERIEAIAERARALKPETQEALHALVCEHDCPTCGAHLPDEDITEHRRMWHG